MTNDELLSKTISYLRFPLIVGVVFIHNKMDTFNIQGVEVNYGELWPYISYIIGLFSGVLPAISVPLFFFISGFLFFYKVDFNKATYIKKVKNRINTLFIPYFIWNFIGFLILLIQMHPRFMSLFPLLKNYRIDITEFLSYFWIKDLPMDPPGEKSMPIDFPLWFIRDLMLLVLASPFLYFLIKKLKYIFIALLGVIWFFSLAKHIGLPTLCHQSIFFFPLGAYLSVNRIDFVVLARRMNWCLLAYIPLAIIAIITRGESYNYLFLNLSILVGMVSAVFIASTIVNSGYGMNKFFGKASFFVFAAHGLFISKFMKALVMTLQPQSPYFVLFIYFMVPVTTIFICLSLFKVLCKFLPDVSKIVVGGR